MTVELTTTKVRKIVQENTGILTESVSSLGAGFDFRTFLVNDEWVFRFPNTPSEADALLAESKLLNNLSLPTTTPVFEYLLDKPTGYTTPIAGYRLIRGESMESLNSDSCDTTQLARDLGRTLRSLHGMDFDDKRSSSGLNGHPLPTLLGTRDFDSVGLTTNEASILAQFVSRYSPRKNQSTCARIHGDLGVEHIITSEGRRVEGVIDWANASIGNRFRDFIGLWGWGGDKFVIRVLSNYDSYPQSYDWEFIRVQGLLYCLHRLKLAAANNLEHLSKLRTRLRERLNETKGMSPNDLP